MTDETRERDDFDERLRAELRRHHSKPEFPARDLEVAIETRVDAIRAEGAGTHPWAGSATPHEVSTRRAVDRANRRGVAWWQRGPAKSLLPAAAALVVFIGGVEYGRRGLPPTVPGGPVATAEDGDVRRGTFEVLGPAESVSLPLSIQSAGSEYVATLARFSGESGQLAAEQREIAREVAMTVLYGAALELLGAVGEDQLLEQLVREIGRRRFEPDEGSTLLPESQL